MNKPKIRFTVNKEAEKETAAFFISKHFKDYFFDKFIKDYPELAKIKELNEEDAIKFMNERIDHYYSLKEKELIAKKKGIEENWNKIKDKFFLEAKKIFDGHKWPEGEYTANISLFGMFRLVPGTKRFSIPSDDYGGNPPAKGHTNHVIVHEMLHILFEDFYKTYFDGKLEKMKYYDLLEIVNCIVLNLPQFIAITHWVENPYPQHKEKYERLKDVYNECKSMKEFVERSIQKIKGKTY